MYTRAHAHVIVLRCREHVDRVTCATYAGLRAVQWRSTRSVARIGPCHKYPSRRAHAGTLRAMRHMLDAMRVADTWRRQECSGRGHLRVIAA